MSDVATRRDLHATAFYDLVFRPMSVEHQLAMAVSSEPGTLVGIALNRDRPDFTERERGILSLLRPHVARLLRDAAERRRMRVAIAAMSAALEDASRSVVAVGRDGTTLMIDDGTQTLLVRALGRPGARGGLPAPLAAWLRDARRRARGPGVPEPAEPFTSESAEERLVVRLLPAAGRADHDVLVVERIPRDPRRAGAARLGLSRRQGEVLRWVAEGLSNAEIGERMSISPRTVQKHLENVFDRLGVRTRAAAVSRLLAS
jgi:DNA-binding CsgD family transcriptional regulator